MKLAEALLQRSSYQRGLDSLRQRLEASAQIQGDERPAEDPIQLLGLVDGTSQALEGLVIRINEINLTARAPDGRSLTRLLAERDTLRARHSIMDATVKAATAKPERYSRQEIKWLPAVDVTGLRAKMDTLAGEIRRLDAIIQQLNWQVEVADAA